MRKQRLSGEHAGGGHDGGGTLRWLLTYADMITLLMAFFIMMYSISVLNLAKFRQVAISIRSGFSGPAPARGVPAGKAVKCDLAGVPWPVVKALQEYIRSDKTAAKSARILVDQRGLVISLMSDSMVFHAGDAEVRSEAMPVMNRIGVGLNHLTNSVRVEGHTCDLPLRTGRYPSNWELSTARATNVVRFLVDRCGVDPARLSAAGYAGGRPLVPNNNDYHRRMNRRVDIVIMRPEDTR